MKYSSIAINSSYSDYKKRDSIQKFLDKSVFVPVPTIAPGSANTPDPAISPARNIAAVITPNPCAATSCSLNFLSISLILIPVYIEK